MLGPIGSVVFTFMETNKKTNKLPDKPSIYKDYETNLQTYNETKIRVKEEQPYFQKLNDS